MIDAEYISESLNGKRTGKVFACDCPVSPHRRAKMIVSDKLDGGVLIFCQGGHSFIEMVTELKDRGLWPKETLTANERGLIEKRKISKAVQQAVIWIACYEADQKAGAEKDDKKYERLQKQYSYQLWAHKVIDETRIKNARGYRSSKKQIDVVMKAINILN